MLLLSAVRGLALIGVLALPDVGTPVPTAELVNLTDLLTGGPSRDSVQDASLLTSLGGFVTGIHALQGAVETQIEFRPVEGDDNLWDVSLLQPDGTWVKIGQANMNYAEQLLVHSDDGGGGFASFTCHPGGPWTWTAFKGTKKVGSGTMS